MFDAPYKHVYGAMSNASGLKISKSIRGGFWNSALTELILSTEWTYDRAKSFLEKYKDWARLDGCIMASNVFKSDNNIIVVVTFTEFLSVEEMMIA